MFRCYFPISLSALTLCRRAIPEKAHIQVLAGSEYLRKVALQGVIAKENRETLAFPDNRLEKRKLD